MEENSSSGAPVLRGSPRPETPRVAGASVTSAHVGETAPVYLAWKAYQERDEYANTRKWAQHDAHVDGSLWASFFAGYMACAVAGAGTVGDLLEALKGALAAFRLFYSFYGDDEHVSSIAEAVAARTAMAEMAAALAKAEGRPQ